MTGPHIRTVDQLSGDIGRPDLFFAALTAADYNLSLPGRMRAAADLITEINILYGLPANTPAAPSWLHTQADQADTQSLADRTGR
jgi:hypothetical protein